MYQKMYQWTKMVQKNVKVGRPLLHESPLLQIGEVHYSDCFTGGLELCCKEICCKIGIMLQNWIYAAANFLKIVMLQGWSYASV